MYFLKYISDISLGSLKGYQVEEPWNIKEIYCFQFSVPQKQEYVHKLEECQREEREWSLRGKMTSDKIFISMYS